MAELKNVIEHLQIIRTWAELDGKMGRGMEPKCCLRIAEWVDDALEVLKAQEPIPVKRIDGKRNHFLKCGGCNANLTSGMKFCPQCGCEVKWI